MKKKLVRSRILDSLIRTSLGYEIDSINQTSMEVFLEMLKSAKNFKKDDGSFLFDNIIITATAKPKAKVSYTATAQFVAVNTTATRFVTVKNSNLKACIFFVIAKSLEVNAIFMQTELVEFLYRTHEHVLLNTPNKTVGAYRCVKKVNDLQPSVHYVGMPVKEGIFVFNGRHRWLGQTVPSENMTLCCVSMKGDSLS